MAIQTCAESELFPIGACAVECVCGSAVQAGPLRSQWSTRSQTRPCATGADDSSAARQVSEITPNCSAPVPAGCRCAIDSRVSCATTPLLMGNNTAVLDSEVQRCFQSLRDACATLLSRLPGACAECPTVSCATFRNRQLLAACSELLGAACATLPSIPPSVESS